MKKIIKADLIEEIYVESGFEKNEIQKITGKFLEKIKESLEKGDTVELRGFGTFEPRLRKGRKKARNPKTGAQVCVEPHYIAAFRPGLDLKSAMKKIESKNSFDIE